MAHLKKNFIAPIDDPYLVSTYKTSWCRYDWTILSFCFNTFLFDKIKFYFTFNAQERRKQWDQIWRNFKSLQDIGNLLTVYFLFL